MTPIMIAQLCAQFGPTAFDMIKDLVAVWSKPEMTVEEVLAFCTKHQQSYDELRAKYGKPANG